MPRRAPVSPADKAHARAVRLLAASAKSEAEIRDRLRRAGFDAAAIESAIARLRDSRALDDDALAERLAAKSRDRHESSALTTDRLARRGLSGHAARAPDAALALAAARAAIARCPEPIGHAARFRRVLAALARKGFDEDAALAAAVAVVGEIPDVDAPP